MSGANETVKKVDLWKAVALMVCGCFLTATALVWQGGKWCENVMLRLTLLESAVKHLQPQIQRNETARNEPHAQPNAPL